MSFLVKELRPADNADVLKEQGILDGQGVLAGRNVSLESVKMTAKARGRRVTDPTGTELTLLKQKTKEVKLTLSAAKGFEKSLKRTDDFVMITKGKLQTSYLIAIQDLLFESIDFGE